MTADDLEAYLRALGLTVERVAGTDGEYTLVRDHVLTTGGLRGKRCDIALKRDTSTPYVVPSAIHTRPALVAMDMNEPLKTQASSALGPEWQYWSRRYDRPVTPKGVWAHVLTVLGDDRWEPA